MHLFHCAIRALFGIGFVVLLCLGLVACGSKAPEAVAPDDAANKVQGLFDQSPPEVKTLAEGAVQAMANNDLPRAHMLLQSLAARPDLTTEQQDIVVGALIGVGQKLQELAAAGDEKAEAFRQMHRSSK